MTEIRLRNCVCNDDDDNDDDDVVVNDDEAYQKI